jgi:hypothetical protein
MSIGAILLLLFSAAEAAYAQQWRVDTPLFPYEGQGGFVMVPARVVSEPVYQVGFMAGALLCLPVSLAQDMRRANDASGPAKQEASIVCGRSLGRGLGWPVYAAAGLPFFILKQVFWDGPRKAASFFRASPKGSTGNS